MNKLISPLGKVVFNVLLFGSLILQAATTRAQSAIPHVEVRKPNGSTVDVFSVFPKGKPVVLVVWEITCQPGIAELTNISKVQKKWEEETGVIIIAVSVDDFRSSSRVQPLAKSRGWDYEMLLDPNQSFKRAMNIGFCPYTFVLDDKGDIVWKKGGYSQGDEQLIYEAIIKVTKHEKVD